MKEALKYLGYTIAAVFIIIFCILAYSSTGVDSKSGVEAESTFDEDVKSQKTEDLLKCTQELQSKINEVNRYAEHTDSGFDYSELWGKIEEIASMTDIGDDYCKTNSF